METHTWAKEKLASLPANRRTIVSAHDAFKYFANQYGMEADAVLGIGNDPEADIVEMRRVAGLVPSKKLAKTATGTSNWSINRFTRMTSEQRLHKTHFWALLNQTLKSFSRPSNSGSQSRQTSGRGATQGLNSGEPSYTPKRLS